MNNTPFLFDRQSIRMRRERAARMRSGEESLIAGAAGRLAERLDDLRATFPVALNLGCRHGILSKALGGGRGGIETIFCSDMALGFARKADGHAVVADEEWLPFAPASFDLIISCFDLHWVNDLPGALIQLRNALKPDGLLLASFPGGQSLKELRESVMAAEIALYGGASPRVSPFIDVRDAGDLLQRAGFALPVADSDTITLTYNHPLSLMRDLHDMGETNALFARPKQLVPKALIARTVETYMERFQRPDGRIFSTVEMITITGWNSKRPGL